MKDLDMVFDRLEEIEIITLLCNMQLNVNELKDSEVKAELQRDIKKLKEILIVE